MDPRRTPYIDFQGVTVRYNDEVMALRNVSLQIKRGEFVFICGKTGSGKSTLLKLLTREVRETAGRLFFDGQDLGQIGDLQVPKLRRQMGIVPQDFALLPRKKVWENVAYAMRAVGATRKEARRRAPEILEQVNMAHRIDAFPHELSGGEQQRVAIGRALIHNPKLIILDEPTGNLDPEHSWEIMEVLKTLNREGATIVVATHDMMVVDRMEARVIRLDHGRVLSDMCAGGEQTTEEETARATQLALTFDEAHAAETVSELPPAELFTEAEFEPELPLGAEEDDEEQPLHPHPEPEEFPEDPVAIEDLPIIDEPLIEEEVEIPSSTISAPVTLTREEILEPHLTIEEAATIPQRHDNIFKEAEVRKPLVDGTVTIRMPKAAKPEDVDA